MVSEFQFLLLLLPLLVRTDYYAVCTLTGTNCK